MEMAESFSGDSDESGSCVYGDGAPWPWEPPVVRYTPDDLLNGSRWDGLTQELWDLFVMWQQSQETFHKKMFLWRQLYMIVKSWCPRQGLQVVGSSLSGFALRDSDLDLALLPGGDRAQSLRRLSALRRALPPGPAARLLAARVPLLRLHWAGLEIDVSARGAGSGRNTALLRALGAADWRARPLVLLAKLWARAHSLLDSRRGGLSSYALTLAALGFLQALRPPVLPAVPNQTFRSRNRRSLGELFSLFLRYYAEFPYAKLAVSVRCGRPLVRVGGENDPIWIEEPFDLSNTARTVYSASELSRLAVALRDSHARLAASLCLKDAWPPDATQIS